jgi:hypothetical protein
MKRSSINMAFQMGYTKDELSGAQPVPAGKYTLQLKGFRPKASKDGQSVSLNAGLAIVGNAEYDGRRVFAGLNSKAGFILFDFVHAAGLQMDEVQDEFAGTEKAKLTIPGIFDGSDANPDDPSKWSYQGPMLNRTMEAELAETEYEGKKRNEVRQFYCAVPGCTEKHSTNLIKG